jgi:tetrapyrrole methylase family protein/MazG family protein
MTRKFKTADGLFILSPTLATMERRVKTTDRKEVLMKKADTAGLRFQKLVGILAALRGSNGCPWDREQDARSIANYFLEEVYEAIDALSRNDPEALAEELGDVLMEVVFLARIFEEQKTFSIADALDGINQKMIRRHPHVFAGKAIDSAQRVLDQWIRQKKAEKKRESHFEGISRQAPSLLAAFQIGQRVAHFGFDWPSPEEALKKVEEEIGELQETMGRRSVGRIEEELGDCFFALASVARKLGLNPETVLRRANDKFIRRFAKLERKLAQNGQELGEATLAEMDAVWEDVKRKKR